MTCYTYNEQSMRAHYGSTLAGTDWVASGSPARVLLRPRMHIPHTDRVPCLE